MQENISAPYGFERCKITLAYYSGFRVGEKQVYLPSDVLKKIFRLLDFPSLMAAQCVCKDWSIAAADTNIWRKINVPRHLACKLWDFNFSSLVKKCRGELSELEVSGSGITGKSLASLLHATEKVKVIEDIKFDHCCNLIAEEVVEFLKKRAEIANKDVVVKNLAIDGCNLMGHIEMGELNKHVENVDVGVCVCSRVQILKKCSLSTCKGLCSYCCEFFEDCGIECGICSTPTNALQLLRARIHSWSIQMAEHRVSWRDIRFGLLPQAHSLAVQHNDLVLLENRSLVTLENDTTAD